MSGRAKGKTAPLTKGRVYTTVVSLTVMKSRPYRCGAVSENKIFETNLSYEANFF
jgi:hypothetical protein